MSLTCIATTSGDTHLPPPKPAVINWFFGPRPPVTDVASYVTQAMEIFRIYNPGCDQHEQAAATARAEAAYLRAYHPAGGQRQLLAIIAATPRGALLRQLQIPSLVIQGDCDPFVSTEHGEFLAQCLQGSTLVTLENVGHGLPIKICGRVVEMLTERFRS